MPKNFPRLYHLFFGILNTVALTAAFILSLNVIAIFFSYFTVLSNILITSIFLYFGFFNPRKISRSLEWLYGASVLYMCVTGIIYWSILVNAHSLALDPWINLTLHGVMPIAVFLGWLLFPITKRLVYKNALQWLIPPLLFILYTLIHGHFINWYPYPFLSPVASGGYFKVLINVAVILFGTGIVGLILVWLGNSLGKEKR